MNEARTRWLVTHVDQGHGVRKREGFDQCSCGAVFIEGTISVTESTGFIPKNDDLLYALIKIRSHTSYVNPTLELLQGLLASIERIADAALKWKVAPRCSCPIDAYDYMCPVHKDGA